MDMLLCYIIIMNRQPHTWWEIYELFLWFHAVVQVVQINQCCYVYRNVAYWKYLQKVQKTMSLFSVQSFGFPLEYGTKCIKWTFSDSVFTCSCCLTYSSQIWHKKAIISHHLLEFIARLEILRLESVLRHLELSFSNSESQSWTSESWRLISACVVS